MLRLFLSFAIVAFAGALSLAEEGRHQSCASPSFPLRTPDYTIGRRDHTATEPVTLVLQISIPTADALSEAAMIGLACKLASDFPKERIVQALVLDDKRAARNLALGFTDQTHYGAYLWHLRGRFEVNQETKQASIEFLFPEVKDGLLGVGRIKVLISGWATAPR